MKDKRKGGIGRWVHSFNGGFDVGERPEDGQFGPIISFVSVALSLDVFTEPE